MIDIDKAFEGRWRMKRYILENIDGKAAKEIARDFFEAGIELGIASVEVCETPDCYVKESDILTVDDTFNKWWSLYDKKRGRENCMKKWLKMSAQEQFDCIAATPAYVASTPDKKYRKDPLTYLNGKCWNDEIIIHNGTEQSTIEKLRKTKLTDILVG